MINIPFQPLQRVTGKLLLTLFLAVLYVLLGRLGLALAIGPKLVTAIWPPSGLALAAFVLYRWQALPGILIGSLWLNIGYMNSMGMAGAEAWRGAMFMAVGSSLQSCIAGLLTTRLIRQGVVSSLVKRSFLFVLTIMVCCVIAPSLGSYGLLKTGVLNTTDLSYFWYIWWGGDCAGILVFSPFILWAIYPAFRKANSEWLSFLIISVGFGLTTMAVLVVGSLEREKWIESVQAKSILLATTLQNQIQLVSKDLQSFQLLFYKAEIKNTDFIRVSQQLMQESPFVSGFYYLPRVDEANQTEFEHTLLNGQPISERNQDGQRRPVTPRLEYFPLQTSYPPTADQFKGIDESVDWWRYKAFEYARRTGKIALTNLLPSHHLFAPSDKAHQGDRQVMIAYVPIFFNAINGDNVPYSNQIVGMVAAEIRPDELLDKALSMVPIEAAVAFGDESAPRTSVIARQIQGSTAVDLFANKTSLNFKQTILFANQRWALVTSPQEQTLQHVSLLQMGILAFGMTFSLLLASYIYLKRARERDLLIINENLEQLVQERTRNLKAANTQLTSEIESVKLLTAELKEAREHADAANQAKSTFLANMSHEIRTPLNAVIGYTQLLLEEKNHPQSVLSKLQTILMAGQRLLRLINDILDISKIESGKLQLKLSTFLIKDELLDTVELFKEKALAKGLSLNVDIQIPTDWMVVTDKAKLGQITSNLLSNAIKYTDHGHIDCNIFQQANALCIQVVDTGPGLSATMQAHLFQPFVQGEEGLNKGGTGLGLSLSKQFAHALGGDLLLASTEGNGVTAQLLLPLDRLQVTSSDVSISQAQKLPLHEKVQLRSGARCHVVVADDDEQSLDILNTLLLGVGCSTSIARNGKEVLACLSTQTTDIVFSDIRMPEMDGVTMVSYLRSTDKYRDIPAIAVTASSLLQEHAYFIAQGYNEFVGKPYEFQTILSILLKYQPDKFEVIAVLPGNEQNQQTLTADQRVCLDKLSHAVNMGEYVGIHRQMKEVRSVLANHVILNNIEKAYTALDFSMMKQLINEVLTT